MKAPKPPIDWAARVAAGVAGWKSKPELFDEFAGRLHVLPEPLRRLEIGRLKDNRGSHTFWPERNARWVAIGGVRRYPDGTKPSAWGSTRGLYFVPNWADAPGPLLIVEGGSCTAACLSAGLCVIGRPNNTHGAELIAELIADFPAHRPVFVMAEHDFKEDTGRHPGREGAEHVAAEVGRLTGRKNVQVAFPPQQDNKVKDVRDFLTHETMADVSWESRGEKLREHLILQAGETGGKEPMPENDCPSTPASSDWFADWTVELFSGKPPVRFAVAPPGHPLSALTLMPRRVTLIGAPPGSGKTALTMQMALNPIAFNPLLRVLVANVEMNPDELAERQLARLTGVNIEVIQSRQFTGETLDRVRSGHDVLQGLRHRLMILPRPFDLAKIATRVADFDPQIVVLDYVQRIRTGKNDTRKAVVDEVMDAARTFADQRRAVVAVAAVGRQRSEGGSSNYGNDSLKKGGLACFRESSELEYGADDAYLLLRYEHSVVLNHVKSRHSARRDITMRFVGETQSFEAPTSGSLDDSDDADGGDNW